MVKIDYKNPDLEALEGLSKEELLSVFIDLLGRYNTMAGRLDYFTRLFSHRTSERHPEIDPDQPLLFEDAAIGIVTKEDQEILKEIEAEGAEAPKRKRKAAPHGRIRLDETGLPVESVDDVYPSEVLDEEGHVKEGWKEIGQEVSDRLAMTPAKFHIERVVRHKFQKIQSVEESNRPIEVGEAAVDIVIAPLPADMKDKLMAGSSVLAWLMVERHQWYKTFYRMAEESKTLGFPLSTSTLIGWYQAAVHRLRPLYDIYVRSILDSRYIQCDEVTHQVINHEKHHVETEWIFSIRDIQTGWHALVYMDNGSRSADSAAELLGPLSSDPSGRKRVLQTDGGTAYVKYSGPGAQCVHSFCWDHYRREWERALSHDRKRAESAIGAIRLLYKTEEEADERGLTPEERSALRLEKAKPIIDAHANWCRELSVKVLPKSRTGKAVTYFLEREEGLRAYLYDGMIPISTIKLEQDHRPTAIERKNAIFCDNHVSMEEACVGLTMVQRCRQAGVVPAVWLTDALQKIPRYEAEGRDLVDFAPENWLNLPHVKEMEEKGVTVRLESRKKIIKD